jgi:myosin heavy subunit
MGSKLGIIFAFFLSIAAAGGAYYLYQGWVEERTVRDSVEAKYDQVKEKMLTVQSEKEQLKVKSEEYRTKAEAMQSQLEKIQTEQARIDSEKKALEDQLKSHQGMIAELQKQVAELAQKAKDAQAACGVTPADLKTDIFSAPKTFEGTVSSAAPASAAISSSTGKTELVFKPVTSTSGAVPTSATETLTSEAPAQEAPAIKEESLIAAEPSAPEASVPAPVVQAVQAPVATATEAAGKVLTVNRKFNFVVVNQGLQDGLKMGDKLKVLKQGQDVATIQIEKLYEKFSAATLLEEDPKQQVVEGDEIRRV